MVGLKRPTPSRTGSGRSGRTPRATCAASARPSRTSRRTLYSPRPTGRPSAGARCPAPPQQWKPRGLAPCRAPSMAGRPRRPRAQPVPHQARSNKEDLDLAIHVLESGAPFRTRLGTGRSPCCSRWGLLVGAQRAHGRLGRGLDTAAEEPCRQPGEQGQEDAMEGRDAVPGGGCGARKKRATGWRRPCRPRTAPRRRCRCGCSTWSRPTRCSAPARCRSRPG